MQTCAKQHCLQDARPGDKFCYWHIKTSRGVPPAKGENPAFREIKRDDDVWSGPLTHDSPERDDRSRNRFVK
jgi:hypothetical protein